MNKRYCDIVVTNLEEIVKTCDRHIKNITMTELDLADNEDGTEKDRFYIQMFRDTWNDMRSDALKIMENDISANTTGLYKMPENLNEFKYNPYKSWDLQDGEWTLNFIHDGGVKAAIRKANEFEIIFLEEIKRLKNDS